MRSGIVHQAAFPVSSRHQVFCIFFLIFSIVFLSASRPAFGVELTLQWDASKGAHGYVLHYGVQSNTYDVLIDVGPNLQHTVSGLEEDVSYYFAVTAYNELEESPYSTEVSHTPLQNQPPTANAGSDISVEESATVHLDASDSFDPDDGIKRLYWEQLSGPAVELVVGQEEDICQFVAPDIGSESEALVFQVVVQDYADQISSATCTVTVNACPDTPTGATLKDTTTEASTVNTAADPSLGTTTGSSNPETVTEDSNPGTSTESADPGTLISAEEIDEATTQEDPIVIQKAVYSSRKDKLFVKARIEGGGRATVLTAWAISGGQEIKLGSLRYRKRKDLYQRVFRNLDRAPERVILVSSTGGEASTACSIR
jgi:hypothetical protein